MVQTCAGYVINTASFSRPHHSGHNQCRWTNPPQNTQPSVLRHLRHRVLDLGAGILRRLVFRLTFPARVLSRRRRTAVYGARALDRADPHQDGHQIREGVEY